MLAGKSFKGISCNENGLTLYGFKQVFFKLSPEDQQKIFEKLGYDESHYSLKSRVFVTTIHS